MRPIDNGTAGGKVVERPGRAEAAGVLVGRATLRRGVALSLALHASALLGLSLVRPAPQPEAAIAAFDLVMLTTEPASAPAAPQPIPPADPEPEPSAAASVPSPPPEPSIAPAPPVLPSRPVQREPARPPLAQAPARPPVRAAAPRPQPAGMQAPPAPPAAPAPAVPQIAPPPLAQSSPAWLAGVSEWLQSHRSYPEMARRLGQQGIVMVHFVADHDGRVLEVSLVRGSGTEALDQAAQALLRNARLPPFPPDMPVAQQSLTVPIRYRLD